MQSGGDACILMVMLNVTGSQHVGFWNNAASGDLCIHARTVALPCVCSLDAALGMLIYACKTSDHTMLSSLACSLLWRARLYVSAGWVHQVEILQDGVKLAWDYHSAIIELKESHGICTRSRNFSIWCTQPAGTYNHSAAARSVESPATVYK